MKTWQNLTHMMTDMDCAQEMKKKFHGTIMGIKTTPKSKPVYCKYMGYNGEMKHHFYTKDEEKIVLNQDTDVEVFIPDPRRGLYNTKHGVVSFCRLPYRQHKRGLYEETASVVQLKNFVMNGGLVNMNHFMAYIYDILDNELQEECSLIEGIGRIKLNSWAINRDFCVTLSHLHETGFSLFYHNAYIGQINPDNQTIKIDSDLFKQELYDYLRKDPTLWRVV